jgi:phage shock protein E
MSKKTAKRHGSAAVAGTGRPAAPSHGRPAAPSPTQLHRAEAAARATRNMWLARTAGTVIALVAVVVVLYFLLGGSKGAASGPLSTSGPSATVAADQVVQGKGGTWTNITPDRLAGMMTSKDFTLLNVKTPYIGEIDGTDIYIPYDQLTARASHLPADKGAKIVVYCRSGNESAIASQNLIDLGYTNIWNLAGGMIAWQDSGRSIVQKNRS